MEHQTTAEKFIAETAQHWTENGQHFVDWPNHFDYMMGLDHDGLLLECEYADIRLVLFRDGSAIYDDNSEELTAMTINAAIGRLQSWLAVEAEARDAYHKLIPSDISPTVDGANPWVVPVWSQPS